MSSGYVNKAQITGDLLDSPTEHTFEGGLRVVRLRIKTQDRRYNKASGEIQIRNQVHSVQIWQSSAGDYALEHLSAGDKIYAEGMIETRQVTVPEKGVVDVTEINVRPGRGLIQNLRPMNLMAEWGAPQ